MILARCMGGVQPRPKVKDRALERQTRRETTLCPSLSRQRAVNHYTYVCNFYLRR